MKRFKSLSLKKKRTLAIAGASLALLAVGVTIAYNHSVAIFNNKFQLPTDNITAQDIVPFVDDWQPCQDYPKTATVTNNNDSPRYVRMKLNDYWRVANSQQTDHETSDLAMTWTDGSGTHKYAFYNTQNDDKWILKSDGYYYYYQPLAAGATTESLLKSAEFNCDANLSGEMVYSQGGLVAESSPTNYANSDYHIYVIFETSDIEYPEPQHQADCNNNILYDHIACQTNGPDDNVDFSQAASVSGGNGNGVNTLSAHKDDNFPVYYFRGEVDNNFVKFGDNCYQIVRTTGTGGVKIAYAGHWGMNDGNYVCTQAGGAHYMGDYRYQPGNIYLSPADIGYTYGTRYELNNGQGNSYAISIPGEAVFGNDVEYSNGQYELQGTIQETVADYRANKSSASQYHYFCPDLVSTSCSSVYYAIYVNNNDSIQVLTFANGEDIDGANTAMALGGNNSSAKNAIDAWYSSSFADQNMVAMLEDTDYCNDRSVYQGSLLSKDAAINTSVNFKYILYNGYYRNEIAHQPSIDCAKNDSYTVSNANGNGLLQYPAGMLSLDEVSLAGSGVAGGGNTAYLYANNKNIWTMTPREYGENDYGRMYVYGWTSATDYSIRYGSNIAIRPVVSLKFGTTFTGTGTPNDPYIIY